MVLCVGMRFCWFPGMRVGAAGVTVLVFFSFFPLFLFPSSSPKAEDKAERVRVCE